MPSVIMMMMMRIMKMKTPFPRLATHILRARFNVVVIIQPNKVSFRRIAIADGIQLSSNRASERNTTVRSIDFVGT
jgi:hypothetical protein